MAKRRQELPWVRSRGVSIRDRRRERLAERPLPRALAAPRLSVHVGPDYTAGARRARRSRTDSTAPSSTWPTMMSRSRRCRGRRCAKLQAYKRRMGWTFPWASSSGGDFNADFSVGFTEEQQQQGDRIQLPARSAVEGGPRRQGAGSRARRHDRNRPGHVRRARGRASARSPSRTASSTTRIRPTGAEWMASGACTSGSTAHPWAQREGPLVATPRRVQQGLSRRGPHRFGRQRRRAARPSSKKRVEMQSVSTRARNPTSSRSERRPNERRVSIAGLINLYVTSGNSSGDGPTE